MSDTAVMGEKVSEFRDDVQYFMRVYPERVHLRHREADQQLLVHLERMIRERAGTLSSETAGGHIVTTTARPRVLVRDLPEGELEEFVDGLESDSWYKNWRLGGNSAASIFDRIDERFAPLNHAYLVYRATPRVIEDPQKAAERAFQDALANGRHDAAAWGLGQVAPQPFSAAVAEQQRGPVVAYADDDEEDAPVMFADGGRA